jgi:hypothetical protein
MIAIDQHKNRLIVGRTAGMFRRYKTAKSALRGNYNDLTDGGIYDYCCIEWINCRIYPSCEKRWFYQYDYDKDYWKPCEELSQFKHNAKIAF